MAKVIKKLELTADKVKLVVEDVDRWGYVKYNSRRQMTFNRRHFENALRQALITVPWDQINGPQSR